MLLLADPFHGAVAQFELSSNFAAVQVWNGLIKDPAI
jgi:hypothetical protein